MKKILTLTLIVLTGVLAFSQKIDANAKTLLDKANTELKKNNTFYLKFNYTISGNTAKSGEIYASGDKYKLITPDVKQIADGSKIYTIDDKEKEITVSSKEDSGNLSPVKVLDIYKSGFNISSSADKTINGKACRVVRLTPTNSDYEAKSIDIALNNNAIVQIIETYNDGKSLSITVDKFANKIIVTKAMVTFNKALYPNYIITEL